MTINEFRRNTWNKAGDDRIVGAGTAGCVLANTLSENAAVSVLLIEAGGPDTNPWIRIPIGYFKTVGNPATDWCFQTEPEKGLANRSIFWPRGKVIGGSGAINGLIYVRGQSENYDRWRQLGCEGWGWNDVLPYFIRSERQQRGPGEFHGNTGPLGVSDNRADFEICDRFVEAAVASGVPRNDDCNDGNTEGVGYYQTTTWNGFRSSTASGYLKPAKKRRNLNIVTGALCERILIEQGRAAGIAFRGKDGTSVEVNCQREVLLCAGTIGSPQLLMLSGIGDADHLRAHGITLVLDKPEVGRNLQDHLKIHNSYKTRIKTLNDRLNSIFGKLGIGRQSWLIPRGPLARVPAPVFCFPRSDLSLVSPYIQFHVLPWISDNPSTGVMHPFSGFTASLCPLRPESRGEIRLKSADPAAAPLIRANYLDTENDRRSAIEALKLSREICSHSPLNEVLIGEHAPGPATTTDEQLLNYVRQTAATIFHPVGTCRMGADADAVVDPQLRLKGIEGLRVVDASIMPEITSGNTNAPVVMIAEKASDMILADSEA